MWNVRNIKNNRICASNSACNTWSTWFVLFVWKFTTNFLACIAWLSVNLLGSLTAAKIIILVKLRLIHSLENSSYNFHHFTSKFYYTYNWFIGLFMDSIVQEGFLEHHFHCWDWTFASFWSTKIIVINKVRDAI